MPLSIESRVGAEPSARGNLRPITASRQVVVSRRGMRTRSHGPSLEPADCFGNGERSRLDIKYSPRREEDGSLDRKKALARVAESYDVESSNRDFSRPPFI